MTNQPAKPKWQTECFLHVRPLPCDLCAANERQHEEVRAIELRAWTYLAKLAEADTEAASLVAKRKAIPDWFNPFGGKR